MKMFKKKKRGQIAAAIVDATAKSNNDAACSVTAKSRNSTGGVVTAESSNGTGSCKKTKTEIASRRKRDNDKVRSRRYRNKIRESAADYAKHKEKEYLRNIKRKEEEKLKGINDLSVRRKTRRRKNWKRNSRKCRRTQELNKELFRNTPPDSAEETSTRDENDVVEIECGIKGKKGRKIVHKDRASAYRKLKAAEEECEKQRKLVAKYKKRFQSLQNSRRNIGSP